jgi:hypothetical protein
LDFGFLTSCLVAVFNSADFWRDPLTYSDTAEVSLAIRELIVRLSSRAERSLVEFLKSWLRLTRAH